ncbi:MAG: hypothetical protein ABMB14_03825 [Myxococcota bacterium]
MAVAQVQRSAELSRRRNLGFDAADPALGLYEASYRHEVVRGEAPGGTEVVTTYGGTCPS